jgi:Trk K+ transport system NAD-binding subunit
VRDSGERTVVVCGLGNLGLECARMLGEYGLRLSGVDLLDAGVLGVEFPLVRGDCRDVEVLRRARVEDCRAVLLVVGDARVNIEAALAVRKLNASVRIVGRTAEHHINELLSDLLGNFAGYEPNRLAGGALALAALHAETIGYFRLDGRMLRVIRHRIRSGDRWIGMPVGQLTTHGVVLLDHHHGELDRENGRLRRSSRGLFHGYDPEVEAREGDVITFLAVEGTELEDEVTRLATAPAHLDRPSLLRRMGRRFRSIGRTGGVALGAATVITLAVALAALLFPSSDPTLSTADGFFTALVLMTGGTYADLFPAFHHLSNALRFLSITLSVIGTVAVGLVYAWFTDRLMTIRLRLAKRRPRPPHGDHVLIVGLGRAGRQAAGLFSALRRPAAGVETKTLEDHALGDLAVVAGSGTDRATLEAAGCATARGLLAVTNDDWLNLEVALLARTINPDCALVIRTNDRRFSRNVAGVLPRLEVVCVPDVAAKAFAAAALGENVLDLFQFEGKTIFVVEHYVANGDAIEGRHLAEIAEGFSVMPVLYQQRGQEPRFWSIVDRAIVMSEGDRVVLLGPSSSLQRIERAEIEPRRSELTVTALRPYVDRLGAAAVLARQLACSLEQAHGLLASVPGQVPGRFYPHQASRLRKALEQSGIIADLIVSDEALPTNLDRDTDSE